MKGSGGVLEQIKDSILNRIRKREPTPFGLQDSQLTFLNYDHVEENLGKLTQLISDLRIVEAPSSLSG